MSTQIIDHVVLLKFKDEAAPSEVEAVIKGHHGLRSLEQVLHFSAGTVLQTLSASSSLHFTHLVHARYKSKEDLKAYIVHPNHLSLIKHAEPIKEDLMAVDWVVSDLQAGDIELPPGSVLRFNFFKLKENLGDEMKAEVLHQIKEMKNKFSGVIKQNTCGENFSLARAKGFSVASLMVVPGVAELEAVNSSEELAKIREHLDDELVVDYVVSHPQA